MLPLGTAAMRNQTAAALQLRFDWLPVVPPIDNPNIPGIEIIEGFRPGTSRTMMLAGLGVSAAGSSLLRNKKTTHACKLCMY